MGTTLQNGVYLPNEGERNCYAGLKTNWEILDQKVADVTALQQAVAGALHREIVESLPTTDIDPNTIYMILSGTSATENVYNEYMYVNNAWELIGTSATDLTNYYTKAEVDGKLLLKASASDLTSHTGDTTIHVTASDKAKWNTVALIKQLRLVNTQVGSATTIAFANIDDTNGIKAGDKCMDLDGRMFEITAVDTANQTVTVGSALIDLALDANVVHTSGNENVGGVKTFTNDVTVNNSNASVQTDVPNLVFKNPLVERASTTLEGEQTILFTDKNNNSIGSIKSKASSSGGVSDIILTSYSETSDQSEKTTGVVVRRTPTTSKFLPYSDNITTLGETNRRWSRVYSTEYYYGSNNVEFSTKFVTTDTAQTISGSKTFSSNVNVYNSDSATDTANIILKNSKAERGSTTNIGEQTISFLDKDNAQLGNIKCEVDASGVSTLTIQCTNSSNSNSGIRLRRTSTGTFLQPTFNNGCNLGTSGYRWYDVQTRAVNGVEPSSLSLPSGNVSDIIDISSYLTYLDGNGNIANTYIAPANGYISITMNNCSGIQAYITGLWGHQIARPTVGAIRFLMPILKDKTANILIFGGTIGYARFIPCQGNV